jgi:hypothetical protein
MSKRYALDHKILALKVMRDFNWDAAKASQYTGIPDRTLREWRRQHRQKVARSRALASQKSTTSKQPLRP